jgi:hypothetical protein
MDSMGKCQVIASACSTGTTFDPMSGTCGVTTNNFGTKVAQANFGTMFVHLYYQNTMGPDGGSVYTPMGNATTLTAMAGGSLLPDSTPIYLLDGTPFAGRDVNVVTGFGPIPTIPTALDKAHQFTIGEYKGCNGQVAFYKPATGSKYRNTVDLSGCPPNMLYSVWYFYANEAPTSDLQTAWTNRLSATAPGLPNLMVTGEDGQAHWDRLIDPNVYFKAGACPTCAAHVSATIAPSTGSLLVVIGSHITGQSNGNAGDCARDPVTSMCNTTTPVTAPFSQWVFLPGRSGKDIQLTNMAAIPLSSIQPF